MPLFNRYLSCKHSEDYMQAEVCDMIKDSELISDLSQEFYTKPDIQVVREFRVPECGRISDIVLHFSKRKIFNIECKLDAIELLIQQARDHRRWVNYSYVCIPYTSYIPKHFHKSLVDYGLGLLIWVPGKIVIEARHAEKTNAEERIHRAQVYKRLSAHLSKGKQLTII